VSSAFACLSLVIIAGVGLVLLHTARVLSRVSGPQAVAPRPSSRRQPDGNARDDDGYRVPASQPRQGGGPWKPERRPRGTAARVFRAVFAYGAALAAWYATGFSMTPLAGAGVVAAFVLAVWLTRRRKGR
jgi:hypothetical protein